VARVIAPERSGASSVAVSYGSGALVAVNEDRGLVVTNWHVVRDAAGPITVVFPDGFRSLATVLKTNRDWDLAALAIWRPNARPIKLADAAPRPGESLTIAGYGQAGWYRAAAGRCNRYVSPAGNLPAEMVEVATSARNGDSGGPILNQRGELAGVLWGSARGETVGSYCGRVRWFLEPVLGGQPQYQPPRAEWIAQQPRRNVAPPVQPLPEPKRPAATALESAPPPIASIAAGPDAPSAGGIRLTPPRPKPADEPSPSWRPAADSELAQVPQPPAASAPPLPSRMDQIKTILAVIGLIALLFHALRLVSGTAKT